MSKALDGSRTGAVVMQHDYHLRLERRRTKKTFVIEKVTWKSSLGKVHLEKFTWKNPPARTVTRKRQCETRECAATDRCRTSRKSYCICPGSGVRVGLRRLLAKSGRGRTGKPLCRSLRLRPPAVVRSQSGGTGWVVQDFSLRRCADTEENSDVKAELRRQIDSTFVLASLPHLRRGKRRWCVACDDRNSLRDDPRDRV